MINCLHGKLNCASSVKLFAYEVSLWNNCWVRDLYCYTEWQSSITTI